MGDVTLYTHPAMLGHLTGPGHPERPERLRVLLDLFRELPFAGWPMVHAEAADYDYIGMAHNAAYLERLEEAIPDRGQTYINADTALSPLSMEAALHAAGAARQAADDVLSGKTKRAFCAVRPPGHHAFPDHAEGFCLFNNVFLAALHARKMQGIGRVAILDFDVHHGNGSDAMARRHDGIFYGSSHQWPLYPGTGLPEDNLPGRVINATLKAGDGGETFRRIWRETILPEVDAFRPELILISAGFDAHKGDPLAQIVLEDADFTWITAEIVKLANRHAGGRVVSVLEGGYDLPSLTSGVAAHLKALAA